MHYLILLLSYYITLILIFQEVIFSRHIPAIQGRGYVVRLEGKVCAFQASPKIQPFILYTEA